LLALCALEFSAQEFNRESVGEKRGGDRARTHGRSFGLVASLTAAERDGYAVDRGEES
jgi:hypothetical protein